ncbi:hypothetical protein ACFZ8E_21060 [Methylobacterium sp. HMF5984]|uniref:hypothetical protein n=1 Tax=unclassified Methylobacterium TaxID=2615210 RepID=UPI001FBBA1BA|nr:hypothetical protein [Methylobacterium sp. E-016]MCJ2075731.1 hypothetical protein [Methylobacterium sp. E-016]
MLVLPSSVDPPVAVDGDMAEGAADNGSATIQFAIGSPMPADAPQVCVEQGRSTRLIDPRAFLQPQ